MPQEMSAELSTAHDLALRAGSILLDSLGKVASVQQKTATEFVTDVDRRVEDMLIAGLEERFPGEAILAEGNKLFKGAMLAENEAAAATPIQAHMA